MTYYSEHGQDRFLDEFVFPDKWEGVFVELGAMDGRSFSNTMFLETERDWSGVLIEANPYAFTRLLEMHRPRSRKVLAAVGEKLHLAPFSVVRQTPGWSGLDEARDPRHAQRIVTCSPAMTRLFVPVVPLTVVLAGLFVGAIDYLSIDVEGAELPVLLGLTMNLFDIDVIEVENNYGGTAVETFMGDHGYEKMFIPAEYRKMLDINDFYRRPA